MLESTSIGQRWLDTLAAHVGMASGPEGLATELGAWAGKLAADDAFARHVYETALRSHLAGQLMVRSIELAEEAADGEPGTVELISRSLHHGRRDFAESFLALPFEEALRFFREKRLMSAAEFDSLLDRYKAGGFIARRLASERLQEVARGAIERLLAQGLTLRDVVREIRAAEAPEVQALGIAPAAPHYLDTVVRTNVATAYGYGRQVAMDDPQVKALRPYRQFWTAGDTRVREGHRALHGLVFEGELAQRYSPPLFFYCRCSMTTLSRRQLEARGLSVTSTRVSAIEREGFWLGASAPLEPILDGVTAEPSRQLTTHRRAFEGLTPEEATEVATGRRPPVAGGSTWEPIVLNDERMVQGGTVGIHDGNHRLTAAVEAGATEILARVRVYDENADLIREELRIIPTEGLAIRKKAGAVGT